MHSYARELPKPKYDTEFEEMCATVYGEIFGDLTPKLNGRSGQKQGGIDVIVEAAPGRIGIQCKRYQDGRLKFKHVEHEAREADAGPVKISKLIIATTAANDAPLLAEVVAFSDERVAKGLFPVEVEFWDDIRGHINRRPTLLALYDPTAPGALYRQLADSQEGISQLLETLARNLQSAKPQVADTALPDSLASSVNNAFTLQIDAVNVLLEQSRYREAHERLQVLAGSFTLLDAHQKARWHVQRAVCRLHLFSGQGAGDDMIAASELFPQDEKIAAAGVRGLAILGRLDEAIESGHRVIAEYPGSVHVWTALAYARIEKGERLSMADVPPEFAEESRVLALMCWSFMNAGEHRMATELGRKLLAVPNVALSDKFTALTAAIGWAAEDPVARDHGFIEREAEAALKFAVAALEPRIENLWRSQSVATLPADASNLCYAYYLLDRFDDVIGLCAEASAHMQLTPRLISLKLVTLRSMERVDDLLDLANRHVDEIEPSALIPIADVAASRGNVELVRRLAARNVPDSTDGHCPRTVGALVAIALWNAGKREAALQEAKAIEWDPDNGLGATIIAARLFVLAGEQSEANTRMDQVLEVLGEHGTVDTRLMAADCLYFLKRYREAAQLYKPYCQNGYSSILHSRLLRSYVESGQRAQARALLDSLPAGWTDDDEIRETAIALAQRVADWPKLLVLAQEQQRLRPKRIGSWLLALVAHRYGGSKSVFLNMLEDVPENLEGSIRQQAQLASMQLQYGQSAAGLRRLYRMVRANMHEPEAASAYIACLMLPAPLHEMAHLPDTAGPGTQVRLTDKADGQEIAINIDPAGMHDLPAHSTFIAADTPLSRQLLNARIGDTITIEGQFGAFRQYTVGKIDSVYRALLTMQQERLHSAPDGLPSMWSIRVRSNDGELDLHEMTEMLERNGKAARSVFETYAASPITLGVCANALGVSSLELIQGWPADAAPIRTCNGDMEERGAAIARLAGHTGPIVLDLATLGEIVALDCEEALAPYEEIYISSTARQILEHLIEAADRDRSVARAASLDGRLQIVEYSQDYKVAKLRYLERIREAIDRYCTVRPAYGTGDTAPELHSLESLLGDDEYEALLLAKETTALLLSLDLGLRQLASGELGISGVWTQPFLANAAMNGSLSANKYRFAVQLLFRSNRTFVSVDGEDILFMCQQGGAALRDGLPKVRTIFQSGSSDLPSCRDVIHEFLMASTRTPMTLGTLCALIEYLYQPLFIHPADLPDMMERADSLMRTLSLGFSSVPSWMPVQAAKENALHNRREVYRLLASAVRSAAELSKEPHENAPVPVEVLKITPVPELRLLPPDADSD